MAKLITNKLDFSKITSNMLSNSIVRIVKDSTTEASASPRLLNWVEPIIIAGYTKSIFYTEVDSNLKKGDRVFIVNGNYDSDALIDIDKYKIGRDGYKVLDIDRCKVTLDINYTGDLPWIEGDIDDFIKIHYVRNQREFNYVNKQIISRTGFSNKFDSDQSGNAQNNFIYIDNDYTGISGFGANIGTSNGAGFYVRDTNSNSWVYIGDIETNGVLFQSYLNLTITNNRIKIINGNFIFNNKEWRESNVYKFDSDLSEWIIDTNYVRPFITKSNFRKGNFKGNWNKGVYGSYDEKINWEGIDSTWNNGTTLNTEWKSGTINSNFSPENSYFSEIDEFGLPVQKVNTTNNRGYGYNYFIDMDISSSIINNGNFINCNIGLTGSTISVSDRYYQQMNTILENTISFGEFTSCNIKNSDLKNTSLKSSRLNNTHVESSKSINSNLIDSVFYKSNYESDDLIKIKGYDEWNAHLSGTTSNDKWKIYKFYIDEKDCSRLKSLDKFYIKGLKVNSDYWSNTYEEILNFFDRGLILDSYSDYEDFKKLSAYDKCRIDFVCKLSTKAENKYKLSAYDDNGYYTSVYSLNDIEMPSIDIIMRASDDTTTDDMGVVFSSGNYNTEFVIPPSPGSSVSFLGNNIDFSNAYIVDSYIDSGVFEESNWNSGSFYNYNTDTRIYGDFNNGTLLMTYTGSQVTVELPIGLVNDNYFKIGDIVYLNSVDYNNGISVTRLPNTYKVNSINTGSIPGHNRYTLDEYIIGAAPSIISTLTGTGVFLTSPDGLTSSIKGTNRYNHLHKLRINKSNIKSGIFRRPFITNSNIYFDKFSNSDYNFNDKVKLKQQLLIDVLMSDNSNNINSGLFLNSYFRGGSDTWNNGISWRSIWESGTFNNGVFRQSNWINGIFNDGIFYSSKSTPFINDISSYFKSGIGVNNRYTWKNGTFKNGNFFDSIWENGTFKKGKIYKSTWLNGIFEDGLFGDIKFNISDNNFHGGTFSNGVVVNSNFFASTQSYAGYTSSGFKGINWTNGVFQSGLFGNDITNINAKSNWYNGTFNGGDFTNTAVWYNGIFNDGKFKSHYGNTSYISNTQSDYTWQSGIFNGGEFGTADGMTNSTWWNGEMYGGIFKGKVWNNGILVSGEINGSAKISCVGGTSSYNASAFVDSFGESYYGLWRDGIVTNVKDKFIIDRELFTDSIRKSNELGFNERVNKNKALIKNTIWLAGTFSHQNAETDNVVWLDGTFENGSFKNSSFNPYVRRMPSNNQFITSDWVNVIRPSQPELIYNGSFTSAMGGWPAISSYNGYYSTFSITTNTAFYEGESDSEGIRLHNSLTTLSPGLYNISLEVLTYSSPYNNIQVSVNIGSNSNSISINPSSIGVNNFNINSINGGSVSILVDTDGLGGSISLDNLSIKQIYSSFNLNDDTCVWKDGIFDGGDFYISKWEKGNFIMGTGHGMLWQNGVSNYMNAFNICWDNGLWKNGNWYGSPYEFNGVITDDYVSQILFRIMGSCSGTSSCHIWNLFDNAVDSSNSIINIASSTPTLSNVDTP